MKQFRAILGDSFRESVDSRSLFVLLLLTSVVVLYCFGLSFGLETKEDALSRTLSEVGTFRRRHQFGSSSTSHGVPVTPGPVRAATADEGLPPALSDGLVAQLTFRKRDDVRRLARSWESFKQDGDMDFPVRGGDGADPIIFLEERLAHDGWTDVLVERVPSDRGVTYRIAADTEHVGEVARPVDVSHLFGAWTRETTGESVAEYVVTMQVGIANAAVGFLGMLIAILVCAGFIPSMLQKGTLDLVLARPIGRARLLLFKYVGGLWFIALVTAWTIGGCWLGLGLRTGIWNAGFLAAVPIFLAVFAVLHTVVAYAGVTTRSANVAGGIGLGVWFLSFMAGKLHMGMQMASGGETPQWLVGTVKSFYTVLPKVSDLIQLNALVIWRTHLSEEGFQRLYESRYADVDWAFSLGTTALFAAVMLGLALRSFGRRDW